MNNQNGWTGFLTDQDLGDQQAETTPARTIGQILSSDQFQTAVFAADRWAEQVQFGLSRLFLDKIQELDQKIKVLSQDISREAEENQELRTKVESLESDRRFLLEYLVEDWDLVQGDYGWQLGLKDSFLRLPSHLRKELLPLLHPYQLSILQPLEDEVVHRQTNTQSLDTTELGAGTPKI